MAIDSENKALETTAQSSPAGQVYESLQDLLDVIATQKPELNFVSGAIATVLQNTDAQALDPLALNDVIDAWNYSDAICSLLQALQLALDKEYRSTREKITKISLLVGSATQLIISTALHAPTLIKGTLSGSPGYVVAAGVDCGLAFYDFQQAKAALQFECWFKEACKAHSHNSQRLVTLKEDLENYPLETHKWRHLYYRSQQKKILISQVKLTAALTQRVQFRMAIENEQKYPYFSQQELEQYRQEKNFLTNYPLSDLHQETQALITGSKTSRSLDHHLIGREKRMQESLAKKSDDALMNTVIRALRVAAAVLCLIPTPPTHALGIALFAATSVVTLYRFYQQRQHTKQSKQATIQSSEVESATNANKAVCSLR